jgi:hypothetical protein
MLTYESLPGIFFFTSSFHGIPQSLQPYVSTFHSEFFTLPYSWLSSYHTKRYNGYNTVK